MWQKDEQQGAVPPKLIKKPEQNASVSQKSGMKLSLPTVQWVLCAVLLLACFTAGKILPGWQEWFQTEYLTYLEQGVPMSCDDKLIRFASEGLAGAKESFQVFAAKLEGKTLAMGGEYEVTHAEYLKTVTLGAYCLSDQPLMPVKGVLTSPFGYRIHPITGKQDFHTGVDLAAPKGTQIQAAFYGIVAQVEKNDINGNYVMLVHSQNVCTAYCHLDTVTVKVGDRVCRQDGIGTVGQTGMATGPHLHFELLIDGVRVDPAQVMPL